jgi:hypothetical protein
MAFDITHLLEQWDYVPGQVVVRRFMGKDGHEKIQLRVDLGILQMNADGRPDGKRPFGHPSLLEFYEARLARHRAEHGGEDEGFVLKADDCARLQVEALQYHHRYICLLQLEDYPAALRDTTRNLRTFDFVARYAPSEEHAWTLQQFRPQLIMIDIRARATQSLKAGGHGVAIRCVESGLERLREFYLEHDRPDLLDQSVEIRTLEEWIEDLRRQRPLSRREQLEIDLSDALLREDYETAARVRDELRGLETSD